MIQESTGHVFEKVRRVDVSPMNAKVKIAQLECGHDVYIHPPSRAPRIAAYRRCDRCERLAADRSQEKP